MTLSIVFYFFVACLAIQLIYYIFFLSILLNNKKEKEYDLKPISVILYVKNSELYLEKNIDYFINQKYPKFEILLVNNASSDNTDIILEKLSEKHKSLRIINVENNESFWGNKKYTYTLAIKAAKYEHLIFSEIDCKPVSENWIHEINKSFSSKKTIILGYKRLLKTSSLFNLIIRFDNLLESIKSFSFTKINSPYSADSRNYAFTKKDFYRVNGFINHIKIKNGKEDLFVKDAKQKYNSAYTLSDESFVESSKSLSFKEWFLNKKNSNLLKRHYSFKNQFLLNAFSFSKVFLYFLTIILLLIHDWKIILIIFSSYIIFQSVITFIINRKFKETSIFYLSPILDFLLVLFQISIFISNLISKPPNWR